MKKTAKKERNFKIVHYRSRFGGVSENWINAQVKNMDGEFDNRIYAVTCGGAGGGTIRCLERELGLPEFCANLLSYGFFRNYPAISKWMEEDRPDLVHAHFGQCGYEIAQSARRLRIPIITSFYGHDAYRLPRKYTWWQYRYKKLFRKGTAFLAEGPAMRKKLISLGCPPGKIVVHHIGVDVSGRPYVKRKPGDDLRLLVCGRFVEKKGIPIAIKVLNILKHHIKTRVTMTIVGDSDAAGTMTPEKKKIMAAINKYDLGDSVNLTGFISHEETMKLAYDHHLFLAPSITARDGDAEGGFPVILTEVMATGMPVVAFNHCDIPEAVHNGANGFLVKEGDAETMAERVRYLARKQNLIHEFGVHGRQHVEKQFNASRQKEKLAHLYRELIEKNPL